MDAAQDGLNLAFLDQTGFNHGIQAGLYQEYRPFLKLLGMGILDGYLISAHEQRPGRFRAPSYLPRPPVFS